MCFCPVYNENQPGKLKSYQLLDDFKEFHCISLQRILRKSSSQSNSFKIDHLDGWSLAIFPKLCNENLKPRVPLVFNRYGLGDVCS